MKMKKILAIDPGSNLSAYVVYDGTKIHKHGIIENLKLEKLIENLKIDFVLVEMFQNYGTKANAGASVFNACRWIGRFEKTSLTKGVGFLLVFRKTIVSHHCGLATANDSKVREAILKKYPKGTKKKPLVTYGLIKDEWQAFALASFYFENLGRLK